MRNLTKAITAISLLAPVSAFPLGIGDIRLHSALNQNLEAEIALHVSAGENISNLRVKLAPPEKFDEAGVPWNYFLSKIKFETVKAANGATIIKVSSKEALREPFLDFLVEVSWDKGNLYREFTVLVDPPVAYAQSVIPVVEKPSQRVEVKPKPTVKKASKSVGVQPVVEDTSSLVDVKPVTPREPLAEKAKVDKPKITEETTVSHTSNGQYGPTSRNESLWKVADKTNTYGGVTRAQMMMAIFDANPKAFYKQNVNALKLGAVLDIPEKEVALKLSRKEAQLAFKKQADAWTGVVTAKSKDAVQDQQSKISNAKLKLEAPTEAEISEMAVVVSEKETTNEESSQLKTDGSGVSFNEDSFVLQAKMEKLEGQLAMLQKMLILKDEQIAALQNQKKLAEEGTSELKKQPEVTSEVKTEPKTDSEKAKAEPKDGKTTTDIQPVVKVDRKNEIKPVIKDEPKGESDSEKVKEEPKSAEESDTDKSVSTAMISTIAFPLLGLLGWALWRKGREDDETESDSMFDSATEIIPAGSASDEESISSVDKETSLSEELDDSSFLSEFASSDFHTFDKESSDDVDPVLEADVYLAYGRYQQAEELMRQAIIDKPESDEPKLKLLEIFHANKNRDAFDTYVEELEKTGKNKDQKFWSKVVEMSDELDEKASESPLKDNHSGEKANFSIDETDGQDMAKNFFDAGNNNEKAQESIEQESLEVVAAKDDNEMEFDLSIFDEDENKAPDTAKKPDDESIDFDLSQFDSDEPATSKADDKKAPEDDTSGFDFDLDSIDLDAPIFKETSNDNEDLESFDFDFDTTSEKDAKQDVSDLTDMDEMETKIDLAKAYIDMGDYDAAKTIAQEALEKGNDEQKKAAKDILDLLD